MNCTSIPMLIPTTATANKLLMLSPKPKPTNSRANDLINVPRRKKQSSQKTEGKCKISTAHGLRDRRVRLSIDIARQFFDLQDSLGFDTASKTLDWLLTKSTTAIKDLQTSSECKAAAGVTFSGAINVDSNNNVVYNKKNSKFCTKKGVPVDRENKEERFAQKFDNSDSAKEQRVKARARARKRTAVKNCIRKLSQQQMVLKPADSELLQPIQFCKTCESKLFCFSHKLNGIAQSEETFGNNLGTVITNKLKPSTLTAADNLQEMNSCTTLNFSGDLHGVLEEYINICSRSITTTLK